MSSTGVQDVFVCFLSSSFEDINTCQPSNQYKLRKHVHHPSHLQRNRKKFFSGSGNVFQYRKHRKSLCQFVLSMVFPGGATFLLSRFVGRAYSQVWRVRTISCQRLALLMACWTVLFGEMTLHKSMQACHLVSSRFWLELNAGELTDRTPGTEERRLGSSQVSSRNTSLRNWHSASVSTDTAARCALHTLQPVRPHSEVDEILPAWRRSACLKPGGKPS